MYAALARAVLAEADRGRAAADVERLRRRYPRASKDEIGSRLVRRAAFQCAAAGALLTGPAAFFGSMPVGPGLAYQIVALNRLVLALAALYGRPAEGKDRAPARPPGAAAGLGSEALRQGLVQLLRRLLPRQPRRAHGRGRARRGSSRLRCGARRGSLRPGGVPGTRATRLGATVSRASADALIVGGGLIGCALAAELAPARLERHRDRARRAGSGSLRRGRRNADAAGGGARAGTLLRPRAREPGALPGVVAAAVRGDGHRRGLPSDGAAGSAPSTRPTSSAIARPTAGSASAACASRIVRAPGSTRCWAAGCRRRSPGPCSSRTRAPSTPGF